MFQQIEEYLKTMSAQLLQGCRILAYDGTPLYTPDGVANYNALWLRDFSYMTEYAGNLIPPKDIIRCIRFSIQHRREDGWMPDRVTASGKGIYAAGEDGAPIGLANLDNTPFLIYTVYSLSLLIEEEQFRPLFLEWDPFLTAGMKLIPLSSQGLVYNAPDNPHSPYGFTDTVCKTGQLFLESLLFWRACRIMEKLGSAHSSWYNQKAQAIENRLSVFRNPQTGEYYAAEKDCRQTDIWGMAYMLYINFPVTSREKEGVLSFLAEHYEAYMYRGQVRHLLKGEYWNRLLISIEKETYQNGAYWATASGWLIWCLAQKDIALARKTLIEAVQYFQEEGFFECVNERYQKLPSFVVSATNVYGGLLRLKEDCPAFFSDEDIL